LKNPDLAKEADLSLNMQTLFGVNAFLYVMLYAAIWYGLARYRSPVVVLWSASGLISAAALVILGSRGWLADSVLVVAGQFLMIAGNWARQIALRSIDGPPPFRWMWISGGVNFLFLALSLSLYFSGTSDATLIFLFYVYFSFNGLEYYFSGRHIGLKYDTMGATSVKWAGMVLFASLATKTLAMATGFGSLALYGAAWDLVVVFVGQFLGMVLLCIGFMQIVIDQDYRKSVVADQQLVREQERAAMALKHSQELGYLLVEREEIIRQLTLSSKSAGMGALVASFAHELNQPLTATLLHTELMQAKLSSSKKENTPLDVDLLTTIAECVIVDTQRAGEIIRKLRNLFRMSKGEYTRLDFDRLVMDVVYLVNSKLLESNILLTTSFESPFRLNGDATQLQQVVLNLLNNAIDAMLEGRVRQPHLQIRGKISGDFLELEVEDNGKGMDCALYGDVFSLFKTSKSHGMGVGLWLSRSIVEMHGGQLGFESEPGRGTVFKLRLPYLDKTLLG
jgi:signal transduction histidine kinase